MAARRAAVKAMPPDQLRPFILAEKARRRFAEFVRQAWPYVPQVDPLTWGWHLDAMCLHYEAVAKGEIAKLLVNICPGSAKSVVMTVLWPAWIWTWWPQCQFLSGSYAAELAVRDSLRCRAVVESEWYRSTFSRRAGWTLRDDQNRKDRFANTTGGERYATSVGGGGSGERAHIIGVDDPLNAIDRFSKSERTRATDWLGQTISQRYVDPNIPRLALVMQRLHEDDPAAWLLTGGDVEHLCLTSELDTTRKCVKGCRSCGPDGRARTYRTVRNGHAERVLLWEDPRTEEGELLFPARFPRHVLEAAKAPNALGEEGYAAQHQQSPTPAGGNMFKRKDWRFWKLDGIGAEDADGMARQRPSECYEGPAIPRPATFDRITISVDGTFKKTERGSYVAIHVWGSSGSRRLLLHRVHERMDYDTCERAMVGDRSKGQDFEIGGVLGLWPDYTECVVEDKANGTMLVNRLTNVLGIPRVIAEPSGIDSKEQRASVYSLPYQRAGNTELPDGAPWLEEYIQEHGAFPLGRHNDDVDAQSQALRHMEQAPTVLDQWGTFDPMAFR
jgi:predicted phage terminase large subunit-like protein